MTKFTAAAQAQNVAQDPKWLADLAAYAGSLVGCEARATSYNVGPAVRTIGVEMESGISDTRPRASERSEALRNAGPRIGQHLNNTVVTERVVQQLEEDVQVAEAPGLAQFAESRQIANVAFPAQFRQDDEPAVGLLEGDALIDAPVGDQLFERRDRDRVFGHPLHNTSAVDRDRRAPIYFAHPIPIPAAVRFVLYILPRPHRPSFYFAGGCGAAGQGAAALPCAARPNAGDITPLQPCPFAPRIPPTCIAHVSVQFKVRPFDKRPLFVVAAQARRLRPMGRAYSRACLRTREGCAAARGRRMRQCVVCAANILGNEERSQP